MEGEYYEPHSFAELDPYDHFAVIFCNRCKIADFCICECYGRWSLINTLYEMYSSYDRETRLEKCCNDLKLSWLLNTFQRFSKIDNQCIIYQLRSIPVRIEGEDII